MADLAATRLLWGQGKAVVAYIRLAKAEFMRDLLSSSAGEAEVATAVVQGVHPIGRKVALARRRPR